MNEIVEQVKEYYGKVLDGTKDLKTKACCCSSTGLPKKCGKRSASLMMKS